MVEGVVAKEREESAERVVGLKNGRSRVTSVINEKPKRIRGEGGRSKDLLFDSSSAEKS